MNLGIMLRSSREFPTVPERLPLGRAALVLAEEGVDVVFGDRAEAGVLHGLRAVPGGWVRASVRPDAVYDRFPSFTRPEQYGQLLQGLGAVPVVNPPRVIALARDKVAAQQILAHLGMPPMEADPRRFARFLRDGPAFVKPRFGSFGEGVRHIERAPPPRIGPGGRGQPAILQRAVSPPVGWAGVSVRVLVQRTVDGPVARTPVARSSRDDPVVNRSRGAEVFPLADRWPGCVAEAHRLALRALDAFPEAVELGVDAVLDRHEKLMLIEVNARPRGRLAALAARWPDRFGAEHEAAVMAPLRRALAQAHER